jgi:hypothetical protein
VEGYIYSVEPLRESSAGLILSKEVSLPHLKMETDEVPKTSFLVIYNSSPWAKSIN